MAPWKQVPHPVKLWNCFEIKLFMYRLNSVTWIIQFLMTLDNITMTSTNVSYRSHSSPGITFFFFVWSDKNLISGNVIALFFISWACNGVDRLSPALTPGVLSGLTMLVIVGPRGTSAFHSKNTRLGHYYREQRPVRCVCVSVCVCVTQVWVCVCTQNKEHRAGCSAFSRAITVNQMCGAIWH